MRRIRRIILRILVSVFGLVMAGGGLFAFLILSREPLIPVPSTTHASLGRRDCLECHQPITSEWRQSLHYRSVTGPYWQEARQLGYLDLFQTLRKPCLNCHAPASVLDLSDRAAAGQPADGQLGVECTPNVFRNPKGTIPSARSDDVELGVDCTACHVDRGSIMGAGLHPAAEHETTADERFRTPKTTVERLCRVCHGATVEAWRKTTLEAQGVTCLDCHMPRVRAASVAGGPARWRRSHSFVADKDPEMLRKAVNASLQISADRKARVRITNDAVGHFFPSGANWLSVRFEARDASGRNSVGRTLAFGREEALVLDFWPFNTDSRIAFGETVESVFSLPDGHGTVTAVVRYHDWMRTKSTLLTLRREY